MPNPQKTQRRAFLFLLAILFLAGVIIVKPFLKVMILSATFTILFYPFHRKYLLWTKDRENLSSILSVVSVIFFLIIPIYFIVSLVIGQLTNLLNSPVLSNGDAPVSELYALIRDKLVILGMKIQHDLGINLNLSALIKEKMNSIAASVALYTPTLFNEALQIGLQIFVLIIVCFYLFRDGKFFLILWIKNSPIKDQYERNLIKEIETTIHGVFYGSFLTAVAQAFLATIGFYIAGLNAFLVWGVLSFFMAFLPMLGMGVVVAPLCIFLFAKGHLKEALFLLAYSSLIVGSIDNILRPFLIQSNMHPLMLFLGIFGGIAVFGAIGLLLGPILMAALTATLKIYSRDFT